MDSYLILKSLHIFGVILFVGNIIITGWWKFMANQTANPEVIAFAQRQVTLTDFVFTAGGATLLFVSGISNILIHDIAIDTTWILWGFGLFTLSGIIWLLILIPVQIIQAKDAKQFSANSVIPALYWKREKIWYFFGIIATILPLVSVVIMVLKPS